MKYLLRIDADTWSFRGQFNDLAEAVVTLDVWLARMRHRPPSEITIISITRKELPDDHFDARKERLGDLLRRQARTAQ